MLFNLGMKLLRGEAPDPLEVVVKVAEVALVVCAVAKELLPEEEKGGRS